MKTIYFSTDYSPHDHRFLSAIRDGGHEAFHVRLAGNLRQTEDRPVPEGVQIMRVLGKNMAWLLKLVENGKGAVVPPEQEAKTYMHFVR